MILMLLPVVGMGQPIKLSASTKQNWSGGVAGMRGSRFHIVLTSHEQLQFTHLWADGRSIELQEENGGIKVSRKGGQNIYTINTNISYGRIVRPGDETRGQAGSEPPIAYRGAALLAYKWRGRVCYYAIKEMRSLPPLSYP